LAKIIGLLTEMRDALRTTDFDAEKAKDDGFLRGEDEKQALGAAAARYLSKGRVAPAESPAQFRDDGA